MTNDNNTLLSFSITGEEYARCKEMLLSPSHLSSPMESDELTEHTTGDRVRSDGDIENRMGHTAAARRAGISQAGRAVTSKNHTILPRSKSHQLCPKRHRLHEWTCLVAGKCNALVPQHEHVRNPRHFICTPVSLILRVHPLLPVIQAVTHVTEMGARTVPNRESNAGLQRGCDFDLCCECSEKVRSGEGKS